MKEIFTGVHKIVMFEGLTCIVSFQFFFLKLKTNKKAEKKNR